MTSRPIAHGRPPKAGRRTRITLAALGVVVAVVAAGSLGRAATARPTAGTTLVWALASSPVNLFAPHCFSTDCGIPLSLVQQHILEPGTFGQPTTGVGSVVQSWKAVNSTTYQYKIKPGLKFSNGTTLTAADVAFSMSIHIDKKIASDMALFFDGVQRISSKGDTVTVKLAKANSNWQYIPAASPGLVYSKADYLKNPSNYGNTGSIPVGTGPYKITEFQRDDHITMTRNPSWKGTKFPWDTIRFVIIPDAQARLLALQSGQIDGTFAVPNTNIDTWQKAPNVKAGVYVSGGWRGFTIDTEDGPFKDIHVRKAMAYATDRNGLTQAGTSGRGIVLSDGLPPLIFLRGILPKAELDAGLKKIQQYPYDLAKARAELKKSAYPNGFTTTLNVPLHSAAATQLSQGFAQSMKQVGITVNLNIMDDGPRFQVILDHGPHLGVQVIGEAPDSPNPLWYLDLYFNSAHATKGFGNSSNYKNAQVDKWLADGFATTNLEQTARDALNIMVQTSRDVPYIPVFSFPGAWAIKGSWKMKSSIGPFYYNQVWLKNVVPSS